MITADVERSIDQAIDSIFPTMVDLRRHLHQNPEPSGEERETTLHLYQMLCDAGFSTCMGPDGRGVLADVELGNGDRGLGGASPLKRIAIRGDIDALYIHDAKSVDYRSKRDGLMHACGHDAHTALVFGVISSLKSISDTLPVSFSLRGIFQPAEETCVGAREMIDVGAIEGVDAIMAVHVDPTRRLGRIGLRDGVVTANCDELTVVIRGRGGHAARPHETVDPIAAAAQFINTLYTLVPRATDSQDSVVVTIGRIDAGENANVIPESVKLSGTIRTLHSEVRSRTIKHIEQLAEGMAMATGTTIEVSVRHACSGVNNDPDIVQLLVHTGEAVLGNEGVEWIAKPSMGSEDFAFYAKEVPGAMLRLGTTSDTIGGAGLHTPDFDLDEDALRIGARILCRAIVRYAVGN